MFKFPSPQVLLSCLIGLGTLTTGIVAYDAERVISAVDKMRDDMNTGQQQVTRNTTNIENLNMRVADHEGRIHSLEVHE